MAPRCRCPVVGLGALLVALLFVSPAAPVSSSAPGVAGAGGRALLADLVWLRAYLAWERREAAALHFHLALTTRLDPRPLGYWLNGARMMAYDVPAWLPATAPEAERRHLHERQLERALLHLAHGRKVHPKAAALWIEEGNLQFNVAGDAVAAAEAYRQAALLPDAPFYAARVHAELLHRLGRLDVAYLWLRQLHPSLEAIVEPDLRERAMPDMVLARLRELEEQLGLSAGARYTTQATGQMPL